MIFKGLRFGMLLQLAVGPLFFLTLRSAAGGGFGAGMQVAIAVSLVDALFITFSALGAAALLRSDKAKAALKWIGCLVLCLFGADMILGVLDLSFLPGFQLGGSSDGGYFWQGLILTAANPLTILFWGGVLTAQIAAHDYTSGQLCLFAIGCVLSTLLSLTVTAALGTALSGLLSDVAIQISNVLIGMVLIGYGLRLLFKREPAPQV